MEVIPEVNVNYFFTCMKMYVLIRVDFIALKSLNCFYTKVIHIYVVNTWVLDFVMISFGYILKSE